MTWVYLAKTLKVRWVPGFASAGLLAIGGSPTASAEREGSFLISAQAPPPTPSPTWEIYLPPHHPAKPCLHLPHQMTHPGSSLSFGGILLPSHTVHPPPPFSGPSLFSLPGLSRKVCLRGWSGARLPMRCQPAGPPSRDLPHFLTAVGHLLLLCLTLSPLISLVQSC